MNSTTNPKSSKREPIPFPYRKNADPKDYIVVRGFVQSAGMNISIGTQKGGLPCNWTGIDVPDEMLPFHNGDIVDVYFDRKEDGSADWPPAKIVKKKVVVYE